VIGHVYSPSPPPVVEPIPSNGNGATLPPPRRLDDSSLGSEEGFRRALADPEERVRLEAVTQLGRMKSVRMVDPLAATLAGDPSPAVREAAARALALIGSPSAMPALIRAAQVDQSHDVRRTAQFAIEIIQSK
jgi:HEAT repeat protein